VNPLDFIPKSVLAVLVVCLSVIAVKLQWDKNGLTLVVEKGRVALAEVRAEHAQAVAAAATQVAAVTRVLRVKEGALQESMNNERKSTNEMVANIATERDALRVRLAAVAATNPTGSGYALAPARLAAPVSGGDQPQLSPALTGLVDEAARADTIRVSLLACYVAYDAARAALSKTD
jgi:hypothetical protein